jgi:hypothetical protein
MEKVETFREELSNQTLISYELRFTDEEKGSLSDALDKYEQKEVGRFISHLEFYCQDMNLMLNGPKRADLRTDLQVMVKNFKKTLHYLKRLERGKPLLSYTNTITELLENREAVSKNSKYMEDSARLRGLKLAWEAIGPLENLIQEIENRLEAEELTIGRPKADSLGFIKAVADIFNEHLGRPTTYEDGPFAKVCRIVLEAVGLPAKDPSRAIRTALKNFQ